MSQELSKRVSKIEKHADRAGDGRERVLNNLAELLAAARAKNAKPRPQSIESIRSKARQLRRELNHR